MEEIDPKSFYLLALAALNGARKQLRRGGAKKKSENERKGLPNGHNNVFLTEQQPSDVELKQ